MGRSPTSFNEDDAGFRTFFESRYTSFHNLRQEVPEVFRGTIKWLKEEVFDQENDEEEEAIDEEQHEYENELKKSMAEAKQYFRERRAVAASHMHEDAN